MNYNLERFVSAQADAYETALMEIRNGKKQSHWMWFIFPQLKQLGKSSMAVYYGIENLEEAKLYLSHPLLGARLKEICHALLLLPTDAPYEVMGGIDGAKLRSSMTLFAAAEGGDSVFLKGLDKYYNGEKDDKTTALLSHQ